MRFDLTNQTASSSSESPFELSLICLFLKDLGSCEDNEAETLGQTEDNYIHFQSNLMIKNSDIDGDYAVDHFGGDDFEKEVSTVPSFNLSRVSVTQISGWAHFLTQLVSSFKVGWLCYRSIINDSVLKCF